VFCVNCGKAYEPSYKFCNHCGYPLPSNVGVSEREGAPDQPVSGAAVPVDAAPETADPQAGLKPGPDDGGETYPHPRRSHGTLQCPKCGLISPEGSIRCDCGFSFAPTTLEQQAEAAPPPETAPYATFVSLVLGSALFVSVVVFDVADGLARNRWDATISTVVATVAAVLLARSARGAWRQVVAVEPETDAMLRRLHRRVLRNSAIIILLFFTSAAIVGAAIGHNRAEAVQLAADLDRMNTVGGRISKARSAVEATIPSYVQMYKTIEPDVQELEPTLRRLKTELALGGHPKPAIGGHLKTGQRDS
jgi:zinc-ribbon domain